MRAITDILHSLRPSVQPIGLDLGHDSIKMMQVQVNDGHLAVVAAMRQPMPETAPKGAAQWMAYAGETVRRMLAHESFQGRGVVACLPREMVQIKHLRLPPIPASELDAAVRFEAKNLFSFEPEEATVHYAPAGEVRQGNEVRQEIIVFAALNKDIELFTEQLHGSGLEIESLDVEPCALFRCFERFVRRKEDEQEVNVIVDVGARASQVIIGKGREISFYKPVGIGARQLQEAVSRKLGISLEEARALRRRLVEGAWTADESSRREPVRQAVFDATRGVIEELGRELSLCLRYYTVTFRGQRPGRLRLCGGEAADPQLHAILKSTLSLPVEAAKPLASVDTSHMKPAERRGLMSEWAVALGMSLRHTEGRFSPGLAGTPRTAGLSPATPAAATPAAQIVDIDHAVASASPALAGMGVGNA